MSDEESNVSKVQNLYGSIYVNVADISRKVSEHYPGRSLILPYGYQHQEMLGWEQRSQPRS